MPFALILAPMLAGGAFRQTDYLNVTDPKIIFAKTLVPPTERSHKTYIVDASTGDDGNAGTEKKPFKTIQHAAELAIAGDTVLVKDGIYREEAEPHQAGVRPRHSGAPDAWIRYRAFPGAHPHVVSPTWAAFRIMDVAYIEVSGFDVSTEKVEGQTDPNYQRNEGNGIDITRSHHILVTKNHVHDCGGGGIGSAMSDYMTVLDNEATRNAFTSIYNCSGISLWEGRDLDDKPGFHNIVRGNRSWANENKGPTPMFDHKLTDGNGIIIDGMRGKGAILIENNLSWDNGGRGIQVFQARNVTVRNNTVAWNERTLDGDQSDLRANTSSDCVFENNIVVARPGQDFRDNWKPSNITYRNNLFFGFGKFSTEVGKDNIFGEDPLFRRAKLGDALPDFRLTSKSPAIGKAASGSFPTNDIDHKGRVPGRPSDLGAYVH